MGKTGLQLIVRGVKGRGVHHGGYAQKCERFTLRTSSDINNGDLAATKATARRRRRRD